MQELEFPLPCLTPPEGFKNIHMCLKDETMIFKSPQKYTGSPNDLTKLYNCIKIEKNLTKSILYAKTQITTLHLLRMAD